MRTPDEWNITLKQGIITSEILDACAMTAQARMKNWQANIETAETLLAKRPNSKARKRNLNNAIATRNFYNKQLACLLSCTVPTKITRVWSENENEFDHYASYDIIDNTYTVRISKKNAFDIMENYDVDVVQTDEIPENTGKSAEYVSYYLVNRVIATAQIYGLDYQDTQNFQPKQKNWKPTCVTNAHNN